MKIIAKTSLLCVMRHVSCVMRSHNAQRKTHNAKYGFTFLELLIAVTIFSISAVAIYSSFNVGVRAWRKAEDSYKVRQEARQAISLMGRELRSAVAFSLKSPGTLENPIGSVKDSFEGSFDEVWFWRALKPSDPKGGNSEGIFRITYKLKEDGGKTRAAGKTLYRVLQSYREFVKNEEGVSGVMISGLSGFKLQYAYKNGEKIDWRDDWKGQEESPPFMVKAVFSFPSQDGAEEIKFTEEILIPSGELELKGQSQGQQQGL